MISDSDGLILAKFNSRIDKNLHISLVAIFHYRYGSRIHHRSTDLVGKPNSY